MISSKMTRIISLLKVTNRSFGKVPQNFHFLRTVKTISAKDDTHTNSTEENSGEPMFSKRSIPLSVNEYKLKRELKPLQPENPHLLKVAILGEPNVGKSTLTNYLVKWKVCAVSKKVHTTRVKAAAILVDDNKQIVFLDTPGFVTPEHSIKHHLEVSLVADPEQSVHDADLIAVVIDAACRWTCNRIHEDILTILDNFKNKKSVLILNKVDVPKIKYKLLHITRTLTRGFVGGLAIEPPKEIEIVKKSPKKMDLEDIFKRTENLLSKEPAKVEKKVPDTVPEHHKNAKGWPFFSKVFMVSALHGEGIDDLREYLLNSTKPGDWLYHYSDVIDKSPHDLALAMVREKLLDELPEEIPYNLSLNIKSWEMDDTGCLRIHIGIKCPKVRYKQIIIGNSGQRIAKCVEESRQALQDTFRSEIFLKLAVE